MLRKIRIYLAALFFAAVTLLFLDFTGTLHAWLGWVARIQFLPAVLALNLGVTIVLVVLTLLFGRVYCSVICPLGIFQDIVSWLNGRRSKKSLYRFSYKKGCTWLRYTVLVLFVAAIIAGIGSFVALLAPYSAWGRIVNNLFSPLYIWGNNLLALISERIGSYAFYGKEVWIKSLPVFIVAAVTFAALIILAFKGGRTYCNSICPVGTTLGLLSRFSLFAPVIDTEKCRACGLCEKRCKASCIDSKNHSIDYSRCVDCMDCIDSCKDGAIKYRMRRSKVKSPEPQSAGRRAFMAGTALVLSSAAAKAQENLKTDGGLAPLTPKKVPARGTRLSPPGSVSLKNMATHCTACQLCVSVCPNNVLRPSGSLQNLMQPEMSFEKGYCRPECTKCSEVCPTGAILEMTPEEKTAVSVGHAVVNLDLCIVNTDNVNCGNCSRHCPAEAIKMVRKDRKNDKSLRIPAVDESKCIGCGACENLCPARPLSAIHIEGYEIHQTR